MLSHCDTNQYVGTGQLPLMRGAAAWPLHLHSLFAPDAAPQCLTAKPRHGGVDTPKSRRSCSTDTLGRDSPPPRAQKPVRSRSRRPNTTQQQTRYSFAWPTLRRLSLRPASCKFQNGWKAHILSHACDLANRLVCWRWLSTETSRCAGQSQFSNGRHPRCTRPSLAWRASHFDFDSVGLACHRPAPQGEPPEVRSLPTSSGFCESRRP